MKHKTLKQHLRQMYIPRLAFPVIIMLVSIMTIIINPFENRLKPVVLNDYSQIDSLYIQNSMIVQVSADKLMYSGIDYQVSGKTKGRIYYALEDGHCYLFILSLDKIPSNSDILKDYTFTARLTHNNTMYDHVIASLSDDLSFFAEGLKDITSSTFISQYDYTHSFATFHIIGLIAIAVLAGIDAIFILMVIINPVMSPSVLRLHYYGNRRTLFAIAETEFDSSVCIGRKNLYITDTFFIAITATVIDIIPLENIVWIYKYNEFHHSGGKTKMFYPLCIVTDHKKLYKIHHVPKASSEKIINTIQEKYPEVMVGYNK